MEHVHIAYSSSEGSNAHLVRTLATRTLKWRHEDLLRIKGRFQGTDHVEQLRTSAYPSLLVTVAKGVTANSYLNPPVGFTLPVLFNP